MGFIITLLILILMLGIIIFIHEFGHFLAAKKNGVYVDEFALGMGPTIFKYKPKKSETTYSLRAFPIGGFVSMAEKSSKEFKLKKSQVLENKNFFQVLSVLIMGILFNFILAIVVFFISGLIYGRPLNEPYLGAVMEDGPAMKAGLSEGDRIIEVNDVKTTTWDDVLLEISAKKPLESYEFKVIKTDGTYASYTVVPIIEKDKEGKESRVFGIAMGETKYEKGFVPAVKYGFVGFAENFKTILRVLGSLFAGNVPVSSLSGPVGIFTIIDQVKASGMETLLYLLAYLSVNVGIINLIPIPVFDGGRVLLLIIEKITKKKCNEKVENAINLIGFGLMILLMLYVTFNDIIKLF